MRALRSKRGQTPFSATLVPGATSLREKGVRPLALAPCGLPLGLGFLRARCAHVRDAGNCPGARHEVGEECVAPRVQVQFQIDANGILSVTALSLLATSFSSPGLAGPSGPDDRQLTDPHAVMSASNAARSSILGGKPKPAAS